MKSSGEEADFLVHWKANVNLPSPHFVLGRLMVTAALPARESGTEPVVDGAMRVDIPGRRAAIGDRELALTVREFDLLAFLVRRPG